MQFFTLLFGMLIGALIGYLLAYHLVISESRLQRSYELLDREMDISFRLFAENELLKRNKGKYGKK